MNSSREKILVPTCPKSQFKHLQTEEKTTSRKQPCRHHITLNTTCSNVSLLLSMTDNKQHNNQTQEQFLPQTITLMNSLIIFKCAPHLKYKQNKYVNVYHNYIPFLCTHYTHALCANKTHSDSGSGMVLSIGAIYCSFTLNIVTYCI